MKCQKCGSNTNFALFTQSPEVLAEGIRELARRMK